MFLSYVNIFTPNTPTMKRVANKHQKFSVADAKGPNAVNNALKINV
jgi:hypothetical protein